MSNINLETAAQQMLTAVAHLSEVTTAFEGVYGRSALEWEELLDALDELPASGQADIPASLRDCLKRNASAIDRKAPKEAVAQMLVAISTVEVCARRLQREVGKL